MRYDHNEKMFLLDTHVLLNRDFKVSLKGIFGYSYIKLRHLNKLYGIHKTTIYKLNEIDVSSRDNLYLFLPKLGLYESFLRIKVALEKDKYFATKCRRRNRYVLGYPANGQRTRTNAKTAKRLRHKRTKKFY